MKTRCRRLLYVLAALCVVGFAVLNLLAYNHARAMLRFTGNGERTRKPEALAGWAKLRVLLKGVNLPRPDSSLAPTQLATDCREVSIPAPGGITLCAWYCNRGTNTPLVVLFHGYSADKTALLNETRAFLALGTSVLLVDFRGSGGSSEAYTTIGVHEAEDAAAVVGFIERKLTHRSLVLFGQSMGAVAILLAIDKHGVSPDGIILEAVFDTMLNTVCNRFDAMGVPAFPSAHLLVFWGGRQWGFGGFSHSPVKYAESVRCPVLFMHGTDDPRARLNEGRRVYDAVPGVKAFREFPSVGHEAYVAKYPDAWKAAVASHLHAPKRQE
jgi:pimeloyl-ACP methyl ester carboxylesterase